MGYPLLLAFLLPFCAACEGPPAPSAVGALRAALVVDRTVHAFVRAFRVTVIKARRTSGGVVTCSEIPGSVHVEDPVTPGVERVAQTQIPWEGQSVDARVENLQVPAATPLLISVNGLTRQGNQTFAIARGCATDQTYADGTSQVLQIDVQATTGAPCAIPTDCEPGLTCHLTNEFPGGYCAKTGCTADTDCPPASRCVADPGTGGLCARVCNNLADCNSGQGQDCVGRTGPNGTCGARVCVFALWNQNNQC